MNKATVDSVMMYVWAMRAAATEQILEPCGANIGKLEIADAALRAEVERLAAQAGKQDVTNLTQERALARRHGFLDAMSGGTARELCTLLRYGVKQLEAWHAKYGEDQPDWLPPAGDVRWMEDVASALDGRAIAQPPAQAEPAEQPRDDLPTYLDDLELRHIEVTEERDHLRAVLAAQAELSPAPVGEYPAKALEGVEPVACLVNADLGAMVWPISDIGEAGTYCDEGEFPELLYPATTVSALRERIAELESELRRVTTSPPTGSAPCARLCEHMAFQIQAKSDARRIAELEALLQEAGRTIDNLTVFAGRSGQSIQVRASIDAARKETP